MEGTVNKCISVLQNASSDNERLAGLLMVAKAVNAQKCDADTRRRLFEAVGFKFLIKLLRSGQVPEGCSPNAYKGIAITILACFCSDPQLVLHKHMLGCVRDFSEIIVSIPGDCDDEDEKQLVNDCYDCLFAIAAQNHGCGVLVKKHVINSLCQAFSEHTYEFSRAFHLLQYIIHESGTSTWPDNLYGLHLLLTQLATDMQQNKDEEKFKSCNVLCNILSTVDKEYVDKRSMKWKWIIYSELFHILRSKIGEEQRNPALQLASGMVELCGVPWVFGPDQTEQKLLLLLVHLTCIEVRMMLEDCSLPQVETKKDLLSGCYSLLEHIIGYMTSGPSLLLDDRQVHQLHSAMRGAFNAIIYFLTRIQEGNPEEMLGAVVVASVRVLGSWIAEETTALQDEVIGLLPFLLVISQKTLEEDQKLDCENSTKFQEKNSEKGSHELPNAGECSSTCSNLGVQEMETETLRCKEPSESETLDSVASPNGRPNSNGTSVEETEIVGSSQESEISRTEKCELHMNRGDISMEVATLPPKSVTPAVTSDVLRFLLPGLCHLTAEDKARRVLIQEKVHRLLLDYFAWLWKALQHPDKASQAQVSLGTLCGVFLNLAVLERPLVSEDKTFRELLTTVSSSLCSTVLKDSSLVLKMNLCVLGLLLIQNQGDQADLTPDCIQKFFEETVRCLSNAHCRQKVAGGGCILGVSESYQKVWDQISDLWFLGMQALASCVSVFPILVKTLLKSGWLPNAVKRLLDAKESGVDLETQKAFADLMCAVAQEDKAAKNVLLEKRGLELARHYKMEELTAVLES